MNDENAMQTEPAFTETELARRWNVSIKTPATLAQRRTRPAVHQALKAIRYPVDEILTMSRRSARVCPMKRAAILNDAQPVVESRPPPPERPKRYHLSAQFFIVVHCVLAAEAAPDGGAIAWRLMPTAGWSGSAWIRAGHHVSIPMENQLSRGGGNLSPKIAVKVVLEGIGLRLPAHLK